MNDVAAESAPAESLASPWLDRVEATKREPAEDSGSDSRRASWIPAPVSFVVSIPKACDTPPNVKTGRVSMTAQWITQHAPEPPACFSGRPSWVSYLISAQEGGLDVAKAIERRKPIDYCADCTSGYRLEMRSYPTGNRCFPLAIVRKHRG